jgi:hypothetical protein
MNKKPSNETDDLRDSLDQVLDQDESSLVSNLWRINFIFYTTVKELRNVNMLCLFVMFVFCKLFCSCVGAFIGK